MSGHTRSRHIGPLVLLLLGSTQSLSAQQAGLVANRGVALVIGNASYPTKPLRTTQRDATNFGNVLQRLGFATDIKIDLTASELTAAINDFARRASGVAGPIVIYYAGHGIQVNGVNYLVPVDAGLGSVTDIPSRTVSVEQVFTALRPLEARPKILILDACRANPFARVSATEWVPGLAPPANAPANTLIAFATDPGSIAADGIGTHSPYTSSLMRAMQKPGRLVEDVFRAVREEVKLRTDDMQTPWENTSLVNQFYFWDPVLLTTRITDGDDDVIILVNGAEVADWNNDGANLRSAQLQGGRNTVVIKVYNQRSYTGGIPPFGHFPEGWRYSVEFRTAEDKTLLQFHDGEDQPPDNGARHGKLFTVATFDVILDESTGVVSIGQTDLEAWKHPIRGDTTCTVSNHPLARG